MYRHCLFVQLINGLLKCFKFCFQIEICVSFITSQNIRQLVKLKFSQLAHIWKVIIAEISIGWDVNDIVLTLTDLPERV